MTSDRAERASLAHVTTSAFDVHLWSKPFDPVHFDPRIHFLWSANAYRAMRLSGQKIELEDLILFPLKDELVAGRNHFWCRYETALGKLTSGPATSLGDVREFLWPLRCRPRNLKVSFDGSKADESPNVWATIWLWPFGWSSIVEFKVTARFSLDDLEDLGVNLRRTSPGPFVADTNALSLSGLFSRLAEAVRRNLAVPENAPDDVTHLTRYIVFSLELPRGMPVPTKFKAWSASEQLRMVGALRGRKVQLKELVTELARGGFTAIPLGGGNFVVTDFNQGTLLVLRHRKDRPPLARPRGDTNHCLFGNLRTFLMIYFALHRFIQYAKDRTDIASAVSNAKELLRHLPDEYRSPLCAVFREHYSFA
jgi:hypothetical protein